jgi:hypothetical protein
VGEVALAVVAVALAFASTWWSLRAVQTPGKQWTYEARVIEGHELIDEYARRVPAFFPRLL